MFQKLLTSTEDELRAKFHQDKWIRDSYVYGISFNNFSLVEDKSSFKPSSEVISFNSVDEKSARYRIGMVLEGTYRENSDKFNPEEMRLKAFLSSCIILDDSSLNSLILDKLGKIANEYATDVISIMRRIGVRKLLLIKAMFDNLAISENSKNVLFDLCAVNTEADPEEYCDEHNLWMVWEYNKIIGYIDEAIKANPKLVETIRKGNQKAIGKLFGEVMKALNRNVDPEYLNQLLMERLK